MERNFNRRTFISKAGKTSGVAAIVASLGHRLAAEDAAASEAIQETGRTIKHSACRWCYGKFKLDDLCVAGKEFGLHSVELVQPAQVETAQETRNDVCDFHKRQDKSC